MSKRLEYFLRYWHRAQDAWVKYQSEAPSPPAWLRSVQSRSKSVAWYINSIVQPDLLRYSRAMGIPAILHVHELELGLQWVNGKEDVSELVSIPDLVITCSEAAKKMMKTLGREGSIEVIYPAIKTERWVEAGRVSSRLKRSELGIPKDAFVWACSGHVCPRKNPILFIHLLAGLKAKGLPVHFLWIGNSEGPYAWYAKCLSRELGLEASITWAGQQTDDYRDWMQIADGYVLTSTQESFSIATMEAACLGKPIVATPCGGVAEILKPGMGVLLKDWSVEGGVEALVSVMTRSIDFDPEISRERVREFDLAVQGPKWEKLLLERYLR